MIEHESDLWPERRWAIQRFSTRAPSPDIPTAQVVPFKSERERDAWVAKDPARYAVGKRHPLVKSLRREWARLARIRSAFTPEESTP